MEPDRWARVESLFHEIRELEPGVRGERLAQACGDDDTLRRAVQSMLAADDGAGGFMDEPVVGAAIDRAFEDAGDAMIGALAGRYRIVRELGAGGMGRVYLGERADEAFEQRVAVKVLKRGLDTDELLRRFRTERQVLANLEHANIARLIDGGALEDGRPYLVMEYVDGLPIDRYCGDHGVDVRERLRLFCDVCAAVQFAHQHLVIHRDLKPGNILVASDGSIKLLDFGIAKVLTPNAVAEVTAAEARLLTPRYTSPEQARGEPATTASDVYALGVVLYELLVGRPPYDFDESSTTALETVLTQAPTRPSSAAGADRRLARRLAGDLDTIVLAALRKEPQRRYATVDQLAADLRRHLDGLPVTARPDTWAYRTSKFVRRHRLGVTVAAAVLAILVTGIVVIRHQASLTEEARVRAVQQARIAEGISTFLESMLASVDPHVALGRDVVVLRGLLDDAAERAQRELEGVPEVAGPIHLTIGQTYAALAIHAEALAHLERAVALIERTNGSASLAYAEACTAFAACLLEADDPDRAEEQLRTALDIRRAAYGSAAPQVAVDLSLLGVITQAQGDYDRAEPHLREAVAILRAAGSDHADDLFTALGNLGVMLSQTDRREEAEPLLREALDVGRAALADGSPQLGDLLHNLATLVRRNGDHADAVALYEEALVVKRLAFEPDHPSIAVSLNNLGTAFEGLGEFDAAAARFEEALAIQRASLGDGHRDVGTTLNNLGRLLHRAGRHDEAEERLLEAVAVYEAALGKEHFWVSIVLTNLARLYIDMKLLEDAEARMLAAHAIVEASGGADSRHWQRSVERLADLYEGWGRASEAVAWRSRLDG